jgi:hypothetical protein
VQKKTGQLELAESEEKREKSKNEEKREKSKNERR